jgi:fructose transport system substrate-binding protein
MARPTHLVSLVVALGAAAVLVIVLAACGDDRQTVTVGLITKRESNPFFVKLRHSAEKAAGDEKVDLLTATGRSDVDNRTQVRALAAMTKEGAKGILITPAESSAIVPAIERARRAGVTVIALDTPTRPASAVDGFFGTNNLKAGELIGRYARAKAEEKGLKPRIATLDLAPGITSGELRHRGFLKGFGLRAGDPEIVGSADTLGEQERSRVAMTRLLRRHPDINVVYTVNEPAAFGAADALKAAGKSQDDVILVSVDGGCDAIKDGVRPGVIDATAQQYPENMATKGVDAIAAKVRDGTRPSTYLDTGVELITADAADGVPSKDEAFGVRNCWGR